MEEAKFKRYQVSLNIDQVNKFHSACKKLKLPKSTLSTACNDIIRDLTPILEKAISQGNLSIADIFKYMGEQMELVIQEERSEIDERKKRKEEAEARM
jgi:hypothetical protein